MSYLRMRMVSGKQQIQYCGHCNYYLRYVHRDSCLQLCKNNFCIVARWPDNFSCVDDNILELLNGLVSYGRR